MDEQRPTLEELEERISKLKDELDELEKLLDSIDYNVILCDAGEEE